VNYSKDLQKKRILGLVIFSYRVSGNFGLAVFFRMEYNKTK